MPISQADAMRELYNYAMEEMRNRGLEEAAELIQRRYHSALGRERAEADYLAECIRRLKRNASEKLSDWWAAPAPEGESQSTGCQ